MQMRGALAMEWKIKKRNKTKKKLKQGGVVHGGVSVRVEKEAGPS
jgi:hypothetical protein